MYVLLYSEFSHFNQFSKLIEIDVFTQRFYYKFIDFIDREILILTTNKKTTILLQYLNDFFF